MELLTALNYCKKLVLKYLSFKCVYISLRRENKNYFTNNPVCLLPTMSIQIHNTMVFNSRTALKTCIHVM